MKISYNWLQSHLEKKLSQAEDLERLITFGFAEIESVEKIKIGGGADYIFDIKILPDRACYALSYRGIAREVAAILGWKFKEKEVDAPKTSRIARSINVRVSDKNLCLRYTARVVENVSVGQSPKWLRERLESIGERSINNIVDATNFVMFDIGQPLHAFDAEKVKGDIEVRKARAGERMQTLDGKELSLDGSALVIADSEGPLALAGIKGGKRAEVTSQTKTIILEAANFSAPFIRATSEKYGIKTESSRRFENNLSPHFAEEGSIACAELIKELSPKVQFGKLKDVFPKKIRPKSIAFSPSFICDSLGMEVSEKEICGVLERLGISTKKRGKMIVTTPPFERLDLTCAEDFSEEVGRIIGYEKIPEIELSQNRTSSVQKHSVSREDLIRDLLISNGFSEVMTSSFTSRGEIAIEKPLASDKAYCRPDLWGNFHTSLLKNFSNTPLLETDIIKQFEIGSVFSAKGEKRALIFGAMPIKQSVKQIVQMLELELGIKLNGKFCGGENIYECTI